LEEEPENRKLKAIGRRLTPPGGAWGDPVLGTEEKTGGIPWSFGVDPGKKMGGRSQKKRNRRPPKIPPRRGDGKITAALERLSNDVLRTSLDALVVENEDVNRMPERDRALWGGPRG